MAHRILAKMNTGSASFVGTEVMWQISKLFNLKVTYMSQKGKKETQITT